MSGWPTVRMESIHQELKEPVYLKAHHRSAVFCDSVVIVPFSRESTVPSTLGEWHYLWESGSGIRLTESVGKSSCCRGSPLRVRNRQAGFLQITNVASACSTHPPTHPLAQGRVGMTPGWIAVWSWRRLLASPHFPLSPFGVGWGRAFENFVV